VPRAGRRREQVGEAGGRVPPAGPAHRGDVALHLPRDQVGARPAGDGEDDACPPDLIPRRGLAPRELRQHVLICPRDPHTARLPATHPATSDEDAHQSAASPRPEFQALHEARDTREQAEESWREYLARAELLRNTGLIGDALVLLALIRVRSGDYRGAVQLYDRLMEILDPYYEYKGEDAALVQALHGFNRLQIEFVWHVAESALATGELTEAARKYYYARRLAEELGDPEALAVSLFGLASVSEEAGHVQEASRRYQDVIEALGRDSSHDVVRQARERLRSLSNPTRSTSV
jgi:tetratricopeptide (TPR) repeat protein